jgi:hypothetical protein
VLDLRAKKPKAHGAANFVRNGVPVASCEVLQVAGSFHFKSRGDDYREFQSLTSLSSSLSTEEKEGLNMSPPLGQLGERTKFRAARRVMPKRRATVSVFRSAGATPPMSSASRAFSAERPLFS